MLTQRNRLCLCCILMVLVATLPINAYAAFDGLVASGGKIFTGLRDIIYPASAVGIIAICICGAFGSINWKWLTVIIIGLIVMSLCAGFVSMFVGADVTKDIPKNVMNGD